MEEMERDAASNAPSFYLGPPDPVVGRNSIPVLNKPEQKITGEIGRLYDTERASLLSFLTTRNVEHRVMMQAYEKEKDIMKQGANQMMNTQY